MIRPCHRSLPDDVTRLIRLTNELLDAESLASGRIKLDRRAVTVQSVFDELQHVMEYSSTSYKIKLETSAEDVECFADRNRLLQILCNLTGNAIKASTPGSVVEITAIHGSTFTEFRVIDSGLGLTPEEQAKIFERFVRLADDDKGKGVGLSIGRSLVELHGGEND